MPYPRKFQALLELERSDIAAPPQTWITWSVCACTPEACGWGGWVLEAVFDTTELTGGPAHLQSGAYEGHCPNCGGDLFRTGASYRLEPSGDQSLFQVAGRDYAVVPTEYDDD